MVVGRLWRRAPAWRFCLAVAIGFTAMTWMFPPDLAPLGAQLRERLRGHPASSPHYVPPSAQAPVPGGEDYISIGFPPFGLGRSGVIPVAGRAVPLPPGVWQEVATSQERNEPPLQAELLARIENDGLTGLMLVSAPAPLAHAAGPVGLPPACLPTRALLRVLAPPDPDPLTHRCWSLIGTAFDEKTLGASHNVIIQRGLERLRKMGVGVPEAQLLLQSYHSDPKGWLGVLMFVPDRRPEAERDGGKAPHPVEAWSRALVGVQDAGFAGRLDDKALAAAHLAASP